MHKGENFTAACILPATWLIWQLLNSSSIGSRARDITSLMGPMWSTQEVWKDLIRKSQRQTSKTSATSLLEKKEKPNCDLCQKRKCIPCVILCRIIFPKGNRLVWECMEIL